jgi:hypothetical protein
LGDGKLPPDRCFLLAMFRENRQDIISAAKPAKSGLSALKPLRQRRNPAFVSTLCDGHFYKEV